MRPDQNGSLVFRVMRGNPGKWNVMEAGIEKPLASFDTQNDASEYAFGLACMKDGSKLEIFSDDTVPIVEYLADDQVITVRTSIGMAIYQGHGKNYTHLIKRADATMHPAGMYGSTASFQQFTRH